LKPGLDLRHDLYGAEMATAGPDFTSTFGTERVGVWDGPVKFRTYVSRRKLSGQSNR